jgi:hypothetical protein
MNTESGFIDARSDLFGSLEDASCEDMIQVHSSGQCNLCGLGYYLDSFGNCQSNPVSSCLIESTRSYEHFGQVFDSEISDEVFKHVVSKKDKGPLLSKQNLNTVDYEKNGRILVENDELKTGSFCYICKSGYYQLSNGSCILKR